MRESPRVDHDPERARSFLLQEIDDRALVVALEDAHGHTQPARLGAHDLDQVGQRPRAIHLRFPLPEQVQIRPVDDDDPLHPSARVTTRRTSAEGTSWPISA